MAKVPQDTTVTLHGYEGEALWDGTCGRLPNGLQLYKNGKLPDAAQLKQFAEFILALAAEMEAKQKEHIRSERKLNREFGKLFSIYTSRGTVKRRS
jgi:hypothetical protein